MNGAGLSDLDLFKNKVTGFLNEAKSAGKGNGALLEQAVSLIGYEVQKEVEKAAKLDDKEKDDIAAALLEIGHSLSQLGNHGAALDLGYLTCSMVAVDIETKLNALIYCAQSVSKRIQWKFVQERNSQSTSSGAPVQNDALRALEYVQNAFSLIGTLQSAAMRDSFYWIVYNGILVTLSLAEPLFSIGYGSELTKHLSLCVLVMESIVNLCTVNFLPWRRRLYALLIKCYEYESKFDSAEKAASSLLSRTLDLYECEEQETPVPPESVKILEETIRVAQIFIARSKRFSSLTVYRDEPVEKDSARNAKKGSETSTPRKPPSTSLNEIFSTYFGIDLENNAFTAPVIAGRIVFDSLPHLVHGLSRFTAMPHHRTLLGKHGNSSQFNDGIKATANALSVLVKHFGKEEQSSTLFSSCGSLCETFFKYQIWDGAAIVLDLMSHLQTLEDPDQAEFQLLQAIYMLKCENADAEQIKLPAAIVQKLNSSVAEIENKLVPVALITFLSGSLSHCTYRNAARLCSSKPNLLVDAALLLWSPYCTAMLDTIATTHIDEPLHPLLRTITVDAMKCVLRVMDTCNVHDAILRGTISLRLAHLLNGNLVDKSDSRHAIQILRRSIVAIRTERAILAAQEEGSSSLCFSISKETMNPTSSKFSFSNEVATLASLHADMLTLLFDIELSQSIADKSIYSEGTETQKKELSKVQVKSAVKSGNEVTLTLNLPSNSFEEPSKMIEQRLLAECRKDNYMKAILTLSIATKRDPSKHEERAKLFSRAGGLLDDAARDESIALNQRSSVFSIVSETSTEDTNGSELLFAPRILRQSYTEILVEITPYPKGAFPKNRQPAYYILYGKPAGSGTDVSLTNTSLIGTGAVRQASNLVVAVSGLEPNQSYVFAAAAYDSSHRLLGPSIGKTSIEAKSLNPLPLQLCWAIVAKLSHQAVEHLVHDTSNVLDSLHHTIREKARECIRFSQKACEKVVKEYVRTRSRLALWSGNGFEDISLEKLTILTATQPQLQSLVHCLLLRDDMISGCKPDGGQSCTRSKLLSAVDPNTKLDLKESFTKIFLESVSRTQYLLLALHVSCMLQEPALILKTACKAYHHVVPILESKIFPQRALQAIATILSGIRKVPRSMWNDTVYSTYSRCAYELVRFSQSFQEVNFSEKALLNSESFFSIEDEGEMEESNQSEDAIILSRDRNSQDESIEALSMILKRFFQSSSGNERKLLQAIHQALLSEQNFDDIEQGSDVGVISTEDAILLDLSRAKDMNGAQGIERAMNSLQKHGLENAQSFLSLICQVCRSSLQFRSLPTLDWCQNFQHLLLDINPESTSYPTKSVQDVIDEEKEEKYDPFESTLCRAYPYTNERDPLGLVAFKDACDEPLLDDPLLPSSSARQSVEDAEMSGDVSARSRATEKEITGDVEEEKQTEEQDEEERLQEELARKAKEVKQMQLERRSRLNSSKFETPCSQEKNQFLYLAELEAIKASKVFLDALDVNLLDTQPKILYGFDSLFIDTLLKEGPRTDLKWKSKPSDESEASRLVPPLKALANIRESRVNFGTTFGKLEQELKEGVKMNEFNYRQFVKGIKATPMVLHFCSRGMVRARRGHNWNQLQKIGLMLWNALEFASITPTQFGENVVCEEALAATPRITKETSRSTPPLSPGKGGKTAPPATKDKKPPAKGGKVSPRAAASSVKPPAAGNEEPESAVDEGTAIEPSDIQYDWRPIFRAVWAVLDSLEIIYADVALQETVKSERQVVDLKPYISAGIDLRWCSEIVSFAVQVLCHLKRWPELVAVGHRFIESVGTVDEIVSPILPLLVFAQQHLTEESKRETEESIAALEIVEQTWIEWNEKKKKKKERKRRSSSLLMEEVPEEEIAYRRDRAALLETMSQREERQKLLEEGLRRFESIFESIVRDKDTCSEALEKAQRMKKKAMLEFLSPFEGGLSWLIPHGGSATRRSKATTNRTARSRANSIHSKSTKVSKRSTRSRANDALSVLTKHTMEPTVDPDAENGMSGQLIKTAVSLYDTAIQTIRQKQQTNLLSQALGELGDLYACEGGKDGWKKAVKSWNESADSILHEVESIKSWRHCLEKLIKDNPPIGIDDLRVIESPELGVGYALLETVGLAASLQGAVNLAKAAHFGCADNYDLRMEYSRFAFCLFSSIFACTPLLPTRKIDYACFTMRELVPLAEHTLLFDTIRKDILVQAVQRTCDDLRWSTSTFDKLMAIPLLSFQEYLSRYVLQSRREALAARINKTQVLIELGLLTEASRNLFSVITGSCLDLDGSTVIDKSISNNPEAMEAARADYKKISSAEPFKSEESPCSSSNVSALLKILGCNSIDDMTPDPALQPPKYIQQLLGTSLTRVLALRRVEFVSKALDCWPPTKDDLDDSRTSILKYSIETVDTLIKDTEKERTKTLEYRRPMSQEDDPDEDDEEDGRGEEKVQVERFVDIGAVLNQVIRDGMVCQGKLIETSGELEQAAQFLSQSLESTSAQLVKESLESKQLQSIKGGNKLNSQRQSARSGGSAEKEPLSAVDGAAEQDEFSSERTAFKDFQTSHPIRYWFSVRKSVVRILFTLRQFDAAAALCSVAIQEAAQVHSSSWEKSFLKDLCIASLKIGQLENAESAILTALSKGFATDFEHPLCVWLYDQVHETRGGNELPIKRCSSLSKAVQLCRDELAAVGYFSPLRLPRVISQSCYSEALVSYLVIEEKLLQQQLACGKELDETSVQNIFLAERIANILPKTITWLHHRILLLKGKWLISTCQYYAAVKDLRASLKILLGEGGFDFGSIHDTLLLLFRALILSGDREGEAIKVLNSAGMYAREQYFFIKTITELKRTVPNELKTTEGELALRKIHLPAALLAQFGSVKGIESLLFAYLSLYEDRAMYYDHIMRNQLKGIFKYFEEIFSSLKSSCKLLKEGVLEWIPEGNESSRSKAEDTIDGKPGVKIQWIQDPTNPGDIRMVGAVLQEKEGDPEDTPLEAKFIDQLMNKQHVVDIQEGFGLLRVELEEEANSLDAGDIAISLENIRRGVQDLLLMANESLKSLLVTQSKNQMPEEEENSITLSIPHEFADLKAFVCEWETCFNQQIGVNHTKADYSADTTSSDLFFEWWVSSSARNSIQKL